MLMIALAFILAAVLIAAATWLLILDKKRASDQYVSDQPVSDQPGSGTAQTVEAPARPAEHAVVATEDLSSDCAGEPGRSEDKPGPVVKARVRRLRRQWAKDHNADFRRVDHELGAQWLRTPAGDARFVVSGFSHGREMHICDVVDATFVALRRSLGSEEVWELARTQDRVGSDVTFIAREEGLIVSASSPECIHRIFDDRATDLLRTFPPYILSMWSEGQWSIAELPQSAGPEQWEETLDTLAVFSDVSRRLPPTVSEMPTIDTSHWDPTRVQLTTEMKPTAGRGGLRVVGTVDKQESEMAAEESAAMWRPPREQGLDETTLPSRSTPRKMGSVDREYDFDANAGTIQGGNSAIPALGEDPEHSRVKLRGGRIVRADYTPSSIFSNSESDDVEPGTEKGK